MAYGNSEGAGVAARERETSSMAISSRLVDESIALTRPALQAALQSMAGQQPRQAPPLEVPRTLIGIFSPEATSFLTVPRSATVLLDVFKSSTTVNPDGSLTIDNEKAARDFNRELGGNFSTEQRDRIFSYALEMFLRIMHDTGAIFTNRAAREGDTASRDAGLRFGTSVSTELSQIGSGTFEANSQAYLEKAGRGLSAQQQEDMLRAALECGFASGAVFGAAMALGIGESQSPSSVGQNLSVMEMLRNRANDLAVQRYDDLRELYEQREENERNRREFNRIYHELAGLLGGDGSVNHLITLRNEERDVIRGGIENAIRGSEALHTGHPELSIPERRPQDEVLRSHGRRHR